ncbi:MAG TPA: PIN domain-containing protein [Candidatus Saccharimonadales bacterium]|nr:PIN domain-containing protein [Candidatus Saccharimonadales bacterium]
MIALDTNIFIYTLNADARFGRRAAEVLRSDQPKMASELVFAEILSSSKLRDDGLRDQVRRFLEELAIEYAAVTREVLLGAADLRRQHAGLKLADSIHLASAVQNGAAVFATNDQSIVRLQIPGLKITSL